MNLIKNPYFSVPVDTCQGQQSDFSKEFWEESEELPDLFGPSIRGGLPGRANPSPCKTAIRWHSGRPLSSPSFPFYGMIWQTLSELVEGQQIDIQVHWTSIGSGKCNVSLLGRKGNDWDYIATMAPDEGLSHRKKWEASPVLTIQSLPPFEEYKLQLVAWHSGKGGAKFTDIKVEIID